MAVKKSITCHLLKVWMDIQLKNTIDKHRQIVADNLAQDLVDLCLRISTSYVWKKFSLDHRERTFDITSEMIVIQKYFSILNPES
ncbi:MAG: hypothetical protein ABIA21_01620 [Candidatus Aenigmatarchaeota archaeon]